MAASERKISSDFVDELRQLAAWAEANVKGPDDLIGERTFRRRLSRFGVENTLAATDLWQEARDEEQQAQASLSDAEAELRRVRALTASRLMPSTDDPDSFPVLRARLADADARSTGAERQLEEAQDREDRELETGRERLPQLTTQVSARRRELENLHEVLEAEQQELVSLRAEVSKLGGVRDSLQRLVAAVADQVGR
jgi:chromosome segregation ATPase